MLFPHFKAPRSQVQGLSSTTSRSLPHTKTHLPHVRVSHPWFMTPSFTSRFSSPSFSLQSPALHYFNLSPLTSRPQLPIKVFCPISRFTIPLTQKAPIHHFMATSFCSRPSFPSSRPPPLHQSPVLSVQGPLATSKALLPPLRALPHYFVPTFKTHFSNPGVLFLHSEAFLVHSEGLPPQILRSSLPTSKLFSSNSRLFFLTHSLLSYSKVFLFHLEALFPYFKAFLPNIEAILPTSRNFSPISRSFTSRHSSPTSRLSSPTLRLSSPTLRLPPS